MKMAETFRLGRRGGIAEVWETVRRRELTESERGILCPKGRELKKVYTFMRKVHTAFFDFCRRKGNFVCFRLKLRKTIQYQYYGVQR